jgi:hypothetical protein
LGRATCVCGAGFSGARCEHALCGDVVCPQNATCVAPENVCQCLPGFQGKTPDWTLRAQIRNCQQRQQLEGSAYGNGGTKKLAAS